MAIETYKLANGETRYKAVAYLDDKSKKVKKVSKQKKKPKSGYLKYKC